MLHIINTYSFVDSFMCNNLIRLPSSMSQTLGNAHDYLKVENITQKKG